MLKKRIITAVCLATIFIGSLFFLPFVWFACFIGASLLVAAWEWASLCGFISAYQRLAYCVAGALLAMLAGAYVGLLSIPYLPVGSDVSHVFVVAAAWWAVALLWVQGYPSSAILWGSQWMRAVIGFLVLIPSGLALVFLHLQPQGAWYILLVFFVVAVADIGAYFSGRAFGRRKLAKNVSPGKSWEGVMGGLLACILFVFLMAMVVDPSAWLLLLLIVIPTALVSVLGDLLESMVKRHCGVKDSGHILPGHGGVLDRIDGLTAALPIFVLALIATGWRLV
jgi:phosphatidate cytidylyltransferase